MLTLIPIPPSASNTSGTFTGYDLSVIDPQTGLYYLSDRSNSGIDVFSIQTYAFVGRIGQDLFAGTANGDNDIAGPNGIAIRNLPGGGKLLLAGNTGTGSSGNLLAFNLQSDGLTVVGAPRTLSSAVAGTTPVPSNRVDGVDYAPNANTILAANNSSDPGYLTLFDNASGAIIKTLLLDGSGGTPNVAGNGVEAVLFNTVTQTFFVAVPNLDSDASGNGLGYGGVIEIDPATGTLLRTFDFQALGLGGPCNPTGLVQGAGATMMASSGTTGGYTVFLDPLDFGGRGAITASPAASGGDQDTYDSASNTYFEAARFDPAGPSLGIFNGDGSFSQKLPITNNDHSVAVDPTSGKVFVAYGASTDTAAITNGAKGGIAVFAPPDVHPPFFTGEVPLAYGAYYLAFPQNGNVFGYYSYLDTPRYIYHFDLGYEYVAEANDGLSGVYLYDFKSNGFFYTSPTFPFPYLFDFSLNAVLYYYPDPNNPGHYTSNPRTFYDFHTKQIITK